MKISTKGRYALRILADIAEHGTEKNVPIREIAERQGFSDKYLEGIVSRLSAAGLVKSGRGKYGGYRLVKDPSEYNVYEINASSPPQTISIDISQSSSLKIIVTNHASSANEVVFFNLELV